MREPESASILEITIQQEVCMVKIILVCASGAILCEKRGRGADGAHLPHRLVVGYVIEPAVAGDVVFDPVSVPESAGRKRAPPE
ncbi:MAG: hypothetical protein QM766_07845 [Burkholderiaceae bacterium]